MKKFIGYYTEEGDLRVLENLPSEEEVELDESLPEGYACCSSDRELGGERCQHDA